MFAREALSSTLSATSEHHLERREYFLSDPSFFLGTFFEVVYSPGVRTSCRTSCTAACMLLYQVVWVRSRLCPNSIGTRFHVVSTRQYWFMLVIGHFSLFIGLSQRDTACRCPARSRKLSKLTRAAELFLTQNTEVY
jgi:hypothetical protein